ncbi:MAG: polysaccharide biosynthesis protein, partial [Clostridiales bacterium]|nr:polysaccharide biosynthesis protein [Clostridiales bacterium]
MIAVKKSTNWRLNAAILALWDVFAIHLAYFLALWLRFDGKFTWIYPYYMDTYYHTVPVYALLCVPVFAFARLYRGILRYTSVGEITRTGVTSVCVSLVYALIVNTLVLRMPISYSVWGLMIQAALLIAARLLPRLIDIFQYYIRKPSVNETRVMIIGAGLSGQMLLHDLRHANKEGMRAVCVIDDDPTKQGRYLEGVPVVGGRDDILSAARDYRVDKIFLSIPSASNEDKRDILHICSETGCKLMQLPGMYQLMMGQVTVSSMVNVTVEDLLGRDPIRADMDEVYRFINGKTVLVTGGGGSIGSELCRQIAAHQPRQLIIFDIYENNTYSIQLELKEKYPDLDLVVLIGSVRDSRRMFQVFSKYRPQVVYHAAAHKHVPLMEDSPCESIKNNAIGTYKTAYAAMIHGCERFVLISTDKAVNPTNIMGASKRLCEMIIQSFDKKIKQGK